MNDNKKIAKNSLLLYIRLIVTSAIGIFSTRIVIQNLGLEDYGLYSVVGGIVGMMAFINTVMNSTTYRFIAVEMGKNDEKAINKVFNISLTIHIGIALLIIILAETIGVWYINNYLNVDSSKLNDALFVFHLSILATAISIITVPFQGLITALEKFSVRVIIEITRSIFRLLFVLSLIYYTGDKLRLYAVLMAILMLIPTSLFIIYCKQNYLRFTSWRFQKDKRKYKEMLSFSGWTMFGAGASIGQQQGAALIINYFFGTILNASFGIATQLNNFIIMFSRNLGQAAIPQIMKNQSSGDSERVLHLVTYISKYSFFMMLLMALPILLETKYLLELWLGEIPQYAVIFTQLMIVLGLLDVLRASVPAAIQATGKIKKFQILTSSILLLGLPISYLLFKLSFPPYYIQIVYIFVSITTTIVTLVLLKRLIHFNLIFLIRESYLRIFYVTIFILPLFSSHSFFKESLQRFILTVLFSTIWLIIVIFVIGLRKNERQILLNYLK